MARTMDVKTQNQVLNVLVRLTRLLQREESRFYTRGHDNQAVAAIEAALGRPLVNYSVKETPITECEITEEPQGEQHIVLVCLKREIDAQCYPSFEAALAALRRRARENEWGRKDFDYDTADIETLSDLYASGDLEDTWVAIVSLDKALY